MKRQILTLIPWVMVVALVALALAAPKWPRARVRAAEPAASTTLETLENELVAEYRQAYEATRRAAQSGQVSSQQVRDAKAAYLQTQLEVMRSKPERIKLLEQIVQDAQTNLQTLEQPLKGVVPSRELFVARVDLLRAKIALEKERERK